MRPTIAYALAIALLGSTQITAASEEGTRSLAPAFLSLVQSTDLARSTNAPSLPSLIMLRRELNVLEQHLNRLSVQVPKEYEAAFKTYAYLLARSPIESSTIEEVAKDAQLKNQFFGEAAGFWPFQKTPLINVRVSTFRGDIPAPGYNVSFNPLVDAEKKEALFPFGSDTNEAARLLPPGNYFLRLYKGQAAILKRVVPVGFRGTEQEDIKIDISDSDSADIQRH
jgi:hypothetical protein